MTLRKRIYGEEPGEQAPKPVSLAARADSRSVSAADPPACSSAESSDSTLADDPAAAQLSNALERAWQLPDDLHDALWEALDDGWHPSLLLDAAERLRDIDPEPERSCTTYAAVLMRAGRAEHAEKLLSVHVEAHGPTAEVLLCLARAHEAQDKLGFAERTLWLAVEQSPNHERALDAWCRLHIARGGDLALRRALQRAADLLCAWRAQLRLIELDAQAGQVDGLEERCQLVLDTVDDVDRQAADELAERIRQSTQRAA